MEPTPLPLRDIHLPEPIGWWPPAPGWWGLGVFLVLMVAGFIAWLHYRHCPKPIKSAIAELARIESNSTMSPIQKLLALSILMRRMVMTLSPREEVAGLVGDDWLQRLDEIFSTDLFTRAIGRHLAESAYSKDISAGLVAELLEQVRTTLQRNREKFPSYDPRPARIRVRR